MSEQIPPYSSSPRYLYTLFHSLGFRAISIAVLTLLMLIPLFMVMQVVQERQAYHKNVLAEVAATWGQRQTLIGPVLLVPYVEHFTSVDTVTDKDGESRIVSKDIYKDHIAVLLPETLEIRADLAQEYRQRGIYNALVYNANISVNGTFDHAVLLKASEGERRLQWEKAYVMFGIDDPKAISSAPALLWGEESLALEPGAGMPKLLANGFHALLPPGEYTDGAAHPFKLTLKLHGSDGLFFAPVGKTTKARMSSAWTTPSFQGALFPNTHEINAQGFNAAWDISHLVRNYPQSWIVSDNKTHDLRNFTAGVSLYESSSLYTQVDRAVKYAILFVSLTFLLLFAFEISMKRRLHTLQYVLVGCSLALFYLVLLALAEHIGFLYAYIAASSVTVLPLTWYLGAILRNAWRTMSVFTVLALLYGLLYLLLQIEDYALLVGVGLLVGAMGLMMLITRRLPS
ncbi:cell envelope integrity protein CreD [Candidatus Thiothrix anitrata]|uniref:Cell envelope integrity protein CreD n=1 Tax=Candidatus Thiothrix anitrata TaxID=2823902 RepID=A0ABX7X533_9GAMM|nr:cell envelope integrity protein CreD [Candidatus Thiothrix anitrata]QTR49823.1 cell envelope integrity protein CreD [Candidatus Thiothrix anitrata]